MQTLNKIINNRNFKNNKPQIRINPRMTINLNKPYKEDKLQYKRALRH